MSETGFLAARGGSCGADGILKPKADGIKMLKSFIARVVRPTIKSISWSGLKLTVKYTVCIISSCNTYVYNIDTQVAGAIQATAYSHENRLGIDVWQYIQPV